MLYSLWYGNNANIKENESSIDLPRTFGLLGCYKTLTPYVILSIFLLYIFTLYYKTKYNIKIEWKPFTT
jgi:hypothetical protein